MDGLGALNFTSARLIRLPFFLALVLLSLNMSLPAGASITSVGGKRCTAIPRAALAVNGSSNSTPAPVAATAGAGVTEPAATEPLNSSTATALSLSSSSNIAVVATIPNSAISQSPSQPTSAPVALLESPQPTTSAPLTSTSQSTPVTPTNTPAADSILVASLSSGAAAAPTPFSENLPNTASAIAQSYANIITTTPMPTGHGIYSSQAMISATGYDSPTQAGQGPVQPAATASASMTSNSKINVGSVMGGIMGGVALVGILLLFLWRCMKRKKRRRDSLLTPLNSTFTSRSEKHKYEFDGDSLGPTPLGKIWRAQAEGFFSRLRMDLVDFGSSMKAKLGQDSGAPSVDMNRGNSQFLEPIPQHSRSASAVTGGHEGSLTTKDRLGDWWQRFIEDINFNWRLRQKANKPVDPFASIRSMGEKEARSQQVSPDFSHFLILKDHELRQASERHRRSQSTTALPQLGSLGLSFNSPTNPFADPFSTVQPTIPDISRPPATLKLNPFADSNEVTQPVTPKPNTSDYISNVRRSRGLSQPIPKNPDLVTGLPSSYSGALVAAPRYPSMAVAPLPGSRYPSTVSSQDSYRDTVFSALSANGRRDKCRSDPFDLDRPELRFSPLIPAQSPPEKSQTSIAAQMSAPGVTQVKVQSRIDSVQVGKPRVVSHAETYASSKYSSSKYSSGVSAVLSEWGDPGPDFGPYASTFWSTNETGRGVRTSNESMITVGRAL